MVFGKHINKYYLRYGPILFLGLLALFLVDYAQLQIPALYRIIINGINSGDARVVEYQGELVPFTLQFVVDKICAPLLVIIVSMVAGRFLWRVCFFGSGIRMSADLRSRMFVNSERLSVEYYQANKVGDQMSFYTNDLETIEDCFGSGILLAGDALMLGILAFVKMWKMNWLLTVLSLIPMIFLLVVSTVLGKNMEKRWDARQKAFSDISDFTQESFSGIAVIKAFVQRLHQMKLFRRLNDENEKANVDFVKVRMLLEVFVTLFAEAVICVILGYGGYLAHEGEFNAGELIEFISYFDSIIWPIMAVSELIGMTAQGRASLGRIGKLLETEPDVKDSPAAKEIPPIRGDIEYRGLTFRYPSGSYDALSDISFKISAGENIGVIGKTGSGKTTLADLILRTYNVPDGTLFIDGVDVNRIPIHQVREYAAYVPQDNFLFGDTVANNITFAAHGASNEEIRRVAELSDIDGDVSDFKDGYETVLGERGVTVSGGQKQRISIARALMKNASILILDDSVSAVDTATEKKILDNLRKERQGKTTILIAHRISAVERMDKVVFLDDGKLLAVGTHSELCETCPEYAKMVELQRLEDSEGRYIHTHVHNI